MTKNLKSVSSDSQPHSCKHWFRSSLTQERHKFNGSLRASPLHFTVLVSCVFQLLTSSHVPAMTPTSTHAPRSTPSLQFLTLSMVSTSSIRITFYGLVMKVKLKLSLHATQTYDGVQVQLHVFLNCTKRRWAVIFTRWPVRPDKDCRYAQDSKKRWPQSPSGRNQ